jgi:polysaccharide chain length determinant protein (PEP-CTERM system associated)
MIPKDDLDFEYVKEALRRRFWYIVVPFFLVSTATVFYCIKAPRIYKSTTLLLVQAQEVPQDYVRSIVTSDTRSRLNTLREQVMSRPRLEEIIKTHELYPKLLAKQTIYDAIETMREHITVTTKNPEEYARAPAAFEISYEGEGAGKVKNVTAALADLFIGDNLKLRETQAAGTSKFLDRELERVRADLRKKEESVRQFKEKYSGLLPEQMESNYRILAQLQQHLDTINASMQQTEDRKVLLRTQIGTLDSIQSGAEGQEGDGVALGWDQNAATIHKLRQELESLRARYTDSHPDVLRLTATIANLEQEQKAQAAPPGGVEAGPSTTGGGENMMSLHRDDLLGQLSLIDKQLVALTNEKKEIQSEIGQYRKRIESGPKIEQLLVDLRRGYAEANESYQSLLQKKLQAELSENLERTQKGEQFVILESANLPQKPFKPDVLKLLSMGLMLALGSGLGLAFLLEYLDSSFRRSKDIENIAEIPVLVAIPIVSTARELRWKVVKKVGAIGALLSMTSVLLYALFTLWKVEPTAFQFLMN